jgi:hypothetical protein
MAKKLYIGRGTGIFQNFRVNQGDVYVLEEAFAKAHADMFYSADEYVEFVEARPAPPSPLAPRRAVIEQATAAPGEVRVVRKPAAKKPAARKPATPKK